jgi:hypothetical protein
MPRVKPVILEKHLSMTPEEIIKDRGGEFIERIYDCKRTYIRFKCQQGHETRKRSDSFTKTWCNKCTNNNINDAHLLAQKMNGKFISPTYTNNKENYIWECCRGHQFPMRYDNVIAGKWCLTCHHEDTRWTPGKIVKMITDKKGKCLTIFNDKFIYSAEHITVECENGHQWTPSLVSLGHGSWCGTCNENISERTCRRIIEFIFKKIFPKKRPSWLINSKGGQMELDCFNEELGIALEYNGEQHYKRVDNWQTEDQFNWSLQKDKEKIEICGKYNIKLLVVPFSVPYEKLYTYIKSICPFYPTETPDNINYDVLDLKGYNTDRLNEIADFVWENFGGRLLSGEYINNTTILKFKCKEGHDYEATWGGVQSGSFCKQCMKDKFVANAGMKQKLEDFCLKHDLTLKNKYVRSKNDLNWECNKCHKNITACWDSIRLRNEPCFLCPFGINSVNHNLSKNMEMLTINNLQPIFNILPT